MPLQNGNNNSSAKSSSNSSSSNSKTENKSLSLTSKEKSLSNSASTSPLADKLGKDGKLTQQERQRRLDNNLCIFCGCTGHMAKECPKSTSAASKAKARASTAGDDESKKD